MITKKAPNVTANQVPDAIMVALLSERNRNEKRYDAMHQPPPIYPPNYMHPFVLNIGGIPSTSHLAQPPAHVYQPPPLTAAAAAAVTGPRSSPPQREGDDDQNMQEYFNWLATKYPIHASKLLEIKLSVADHGWGFSDLRTCTDEHWKAMTVPAGFVTKIRNNLKEFARLAITSGDGFNDSTNGRPVSVISSGNSSQ